MNRIFWNTEPANDYDGGDIDEIVIQNPAGVHIEQMDDRCWWIGIYIDGERYWMGNFVADSRGRMKFSQQENAGVDFDHVGSHGGKP